ncbi:MAG TPA: response regulator transcription factor [Bryobacteraceae bacterium]|nr:response regulator transcription factor [Bryobacteraceae bacterium]
MPLLLPARKACEAAMDVIRVLLCNQHPVIRNGLRELLETPGIWVVGDAANGLDAVTLANHYQPDVVLLDVKLAHTTGFVVSREIAMKAPQAGIVFVSSQCDEEYVSEAFKTGARAYVLAESVQTDLIRAVRIAAKGGQFLSPSITSKLLDEYGKRCCSAAESNSESQKRLHRLLKEALAFSDSEAS